MGQSRLTGSNDKKTLQEQLRGLITRCRANYLLRSDESDDTCLVVVVVVVVVVAPVAGFVIVEVVLPAHASVLESSYHQTKEAPQMR
jgi:hypothetical protein